MPTDGLSGLSLFSPFSIQYYTHDVISQRSQEVVWYADSRFRQALLKISAAAPRQQKWMQNYLHRELEFILTIIGKCSAVGTNLDVPIIIRSLAESLMFVDADDLPLPFESSLLSALDAGVESEKPFSLDKRYELDWWNRKKESEPESILSVDTFWTLVLNRRELRKTSGIPREESPSESALVSSPESSEEARCKSCKHFQDIASELLMELQEVLKYSNAMKESAFTTWTLAMRKAAGYHDLHEAVVIKEMQSVQRTSQSLLPASSSQQQLDPPAGPTPSRYPARRANVMINEKSQRIAAEAAKELDRLRQMPPGAYKWVWGEELSANDVKRMNGHNPKARVHTGYQVSLPIGKWGGDDTSTAQSADRTEVYSNIESEANVEVVPSSSEGAFVREPRNQRSNVNADAAADPGALSTSLTRTRNIAQISIGTKKRLMTMDAEPARRRESETLSEESGSQREGDDEDVVTVINTHKVYDDNDVIELTDTSRDSPEVSAADAFRGWKFQDEEERNSVIEIADSPVITAAQAVTGWKFDEDSECASVTEVNDDDIQLADADATPQPNSRDEFGTGIHGGPQGDIDWWLQP